MNAPAIAAPDATSHAANLRWFALIYLAISVGVTVLVFALAQLNVAPPVAGLSAGAFLAAVSAAGMRQAKKTEGGWTPADRAALSGGYVLVALGMTLMACGLIAAFAAVTLGSYFPTLALAWFKQFGLFAMVALLFIAGLYYAGARFVLGGIAKRERRRLAQ